MHLSDVLLLRRAEQAGALLALLIICAAILPLPAPILSAPSSDPGRATATSTPPLITSPPGEVLLGGYSGIPYIYDSDGRMVRGTDTRFTMHGIRWNNEPFINPIYYGVRGAVWSAVVPFGAMIDFTHAKARGEMEHEVKVEGQRDGKDLPPRAKIKELFNKFEFSHGHNLLTLNALYRPALGSVRLRPYVGMGAGVALPHVEISGTHEAGRTYVYEVAGPALQVLAGLELRLAGSSLFVEYKLTFADMSPEIIHGKTGNFFTRLLSHQIIGGIAMRVSTAAPATGP